MRYGGCEALDDQMIADENRAHARAGEHFVYVVVAALGGSIDSKRSYSLLTTL